jgi:hypothetical protein
MPLLTQDGQIKGKAHGRAEIERGLVVLMSHVISPLAVCRFVFVLSPQVLRWQKTGCMLMCALKCECECKQVHAC